LKPITAIAVVVAVFLFGVSTIIQSNLAYATSSEKIILVQQLEQFPGQEITGFCYLEQDEEENLHWRIKVNGLVPETKGHFDLGHWAGETDVPYRADENGKADSETQIIISEDIPYSLFSQFAKCRVLTDGYNHFTSPVIALGVPGSSNEDVNKNQNTNPSENTLGTKNSGLAFGDLNANAGDTNTITSIVPTEKKFFLFATLDYVFDIFTNNNMDSNENNNPSSSKSNSPPHISEIENNGKSDMFSGFDSFFGPPSPHPKNSYDEDTDNKASNDKASNDKASNDKASNDKASNDKASNDKASNDKAYKASNDKASNDKASNDKASNDKVHGINEESKKCNSGQKKKGLC
jgi:hypothetical protein